MAIYINNHLPAHVHAFKEGGEAKVNLDPVTVAQAWKMSKATVCKAKRVVAEHQAYLLERWEEING